MPRTKRPSSPSPQEKEDKAAVMHEQLQPPRKKSKNNDKCASSGLPGDRKGKVYSPLNPGIAERIARTIDLTSQSSIVQENHFPLVAGCGHLQVPLHIRACSRCIYETLAKIRQFRHSSLESQQLERSYEQQCLVRSERDFFKQRLVFLAQEQKKLADEWQQAQPPQPPPVTAATSTTTTGASSSPSPQEKEEKAAVQLQLPRKKSKNDKCTSSMPGDKKGKVYSLLNPGIAERIARTIDLTSQSSIVQENHFPLVAGCGHLQVPLHIRAYSRCIYETLAKIHQFRHSSLESQQLEHSYEQQCLVRSEHDFFKQRLVFLAQEQKKLADEWQQAQPPQPPYKVTAAAAAAAAVSPSLRKPPPPKTTTTTTTVGKRNNKNKPPNNKAAAAAAATAATAPLPRTKTTMTTTTTTASCGNDDNDDHQKIKDKPPHHAKTFAQSPRQQHDKVVRALEQIMAERFAVYMDTSFYPMHHHHHHHNHHQHYLFDDHDSRPMDNDSPTNSAILIHLNECSKTIGRTDPKKKKKNVPKKLTVYARFEYDFQKVMQAYHDAFLQHADNHHGDTSNIELVWVWADPNDKMLLTTVQQQFLDKKVLAAAAAAVPKAASTTTTTTTTTTRQQRSPHKKDRTTKTANRTSTSQQQQQQHGGGGDWCHISTSGSHLPGRFAKSLRQQNDRAVRALEQIMAERFAMHMDTSFYPHHFYDNGSPKDNCPTNSAILLHLNQCCNASLANGANNKKNISTVMTVYGRNQYDLQKVLMAHYEAVQEQKYDGDDHTEQQQKYQLELVWADPQDLKLSTAVQKKFQNKKATAAGADETTLTL